MQMISIIIRLKWVGNSNMKSKFTLLSLVFCSLVVPNIALSADYALDSVVTTGTRTPKLLMDSPVAVQVITSEQLEMVSSGTLAEALNFIPGVVLSRSPKDGYNVQMQGFDGDHVLVLVNGQRVISPSGSSADLDQISALDVERIEVLKGAASVMYGSAAMGGVLNVITKPIAAKRTIVSYEVGSFGKNAIEEDPLEHRFRLTTNDQSPLADVQLNYQYINNPGFKYNPDAKEENGTGVEKHFVDATVTMGSSFGELTYHPQFFSEDKYRQEKDKLVPGVGDIADSYSSKVERITHAIQLKGKDYGQVKVHYAQHDEASGRQTSVQRDAKITLAGITGQQVWMSDWVEVVTGAEFDYEQMHLPDDELIEESRTSEQYFIQGDWFLGRALELLTGYRVQKDSTFGWHQAGRVSGLVRQNFSSGAQLAWRFGVGQSYKVPTLKELEYLFDHSGLGYVVLGNPNLVPEETLSYNLSSTLELMNGSQVDIGVFHSDSKNFIQTALNQQGSEEWGEGVDVYDYQNIEEVRTRGADLSMTLPLNDSSRFQLNYSYLDAKDGEGERVTGKPRHQVKMNFQKQFTWLNTQLMAYAVYQEDEAFSVDDPTTSEDEGFLGEHDNAWWSLNLSFTQQPTKKLKTRFGIQNLLDEHENTSVSEEYFDAREADSRRIYLGLSYQL